MGQREFSRKSFEESARERHAKLIEKLGVTIPQRLNFCYTPKEAHDAFLDHAELTTHQWPDYAAGIKRMLKSLAYTPPETSPLFTQQYVPGAKADHIILTRNLIPGKPPNFDAAKHEVAHAALQAKQDEIQVGQRKPQNFTPGLGGQQELFAFLHPFLVEREAQARKSVKKYLDHNYTGYKLTTPEYVFAHSNTRKLLKLPGRKIREFLIKLAGTVYQGQQDVEKEVRTFLEQ